MIRSSYTRNRHRHNASVHCTGRSGPATCRMHPQVLSGRPENSLQRRWRAERKRLPRQNDPFQPHRDFLGLAFALHGNRFVRRLPVLSLFDIPVGHRLNFNSVTFLCQEYELTFCHGELDMRRKFAWDLGRQPFSVRQIWMPDTVQGELLAPRSGVLTEHLDPEAGTVQFDIDDQPAFLLLLQEIEEVSEELEVFAAPGMEVKKGDVLLRTRKRLRLGRCMEEHPRREAYGLTFNLEHASRKCNVFLQLHSHLTSFAACRFPPFRKPGNAGFVMHDAEPIETWFPRLYVALEMPQTPNRLKTCVLDAIQARYHVLFDRRYGIYGNPVFQASLDAAIEKGFPILVPQDGTFTGSELSVRNPHLQHLRFVRGDGQEFRVFAPSGTVMNCRVGDFLTQGSICAYGADRNNLSVVADQKNWFAVQHLNQMTVTDVVRENEGLKHFIPLEFFNSSGPAQDRVYWDTSTLAGFHQCDGYVIPPPVALNSWDALNIQVGNHIAIDFTPKQGWFRPICVKLGETVAGVKTEISASA